MRQPICMLALTATALTGAPVLAAGPASFEHDLQATIALQGKPCDRVIAAKRNGDSDYVASCKDGNRYHVFVDPQGRVIVQKL